MEKIISYNQTFKPNLMSDISEDEIFKILLSNDDEQTNGNYLEYEYDINREYLSLENIYYNKMESSQRSKRRFRSKENLNKCKISKKSSDVAIKSKKEEDNLTLYLNSIFKKDNKKPTAKSLKRNKPMQSSTTNLIKYNLNRLGIVDDKLRSNVPKVLVENIFNIKNFNVCVCAKKGIKRN
jgi:hypothetical protein